MDGHCTMHALCGWWPRASHFQSPFPLSSVVINAAVAESMMHFQSPFPLSSVVMRYCGGREHGCISSLHSHCPPLYLHALFCMAENDAFPGLHSHCPPLYLHALWPRAWMHFQSPFPLSSVVVPACAVCAIENHCIIRHCFVWSIWLLAEAIYKFALVSLASFQTLSTPRSQPASHQQGDSIDGSLSVSINILI